MTNPKSRLEKYQGKGTLTPNKTIDFPIKQDKSMHNFLHHLSVEKDTEIVKAANLMKYLSEKDIDIRILNNIRVEFLKKDKQEKGALPIEDFLKIFRTIAKLNSEEVETRLLDQLQVRLSL